MDPNLLRTFVTVVDAGSFSVAATRLGYTQSAVSQHIAALEADLGACLLNRRPVTPTEAGTRLLDHAGPILLRLQAARADVARTATTAATRLALGVSPLAAPIVAGALDAVRRVAPWADVTLRVAGAQTVVAETVAGSFDLGLVDGVAAPNDPLRVAATAVLAAAVVAEDEVVVALPAAHPLAHRPGLRLPDLADARWIDAPDLAAPLADLRGVIGAERLPHSIRYDGTDVVTLARLVAGGHGLAVLPRRAVRGIAGIAAVPVTSPPLVHRTELLHHHAISEIAAALVEALGQPESPITHA